MFDGSDCIFDSRTDRNRSTDLQIHTFGWIQGDFHRFATISQLFPAIFSYFQAIFSNFWWKPTSISNKTSWTFEAISSTAPGSRLSENFKKCRFLSFFPNLPCFLWLTQRTQEQLRFNRRLFVLLNVLDDRLRVVTNFAVEKGLKHFFQRNQTVFSCFSQFFMNFLSKTQKINDFRLKNHHFLIDFTIFFYFFFIIFIVFSLENSQYRTETGLSQSSSLPPQNPNKNRRVFLFRQEHCEQSEPRH